MSLQKITDAQMDAAGVCSAPNVLTGTIAQNKAVFDKMVRSLVAPAYNAAVDAIDAINATETGIEAEEALRVAAEGGRVNAENGRVGAEAGRVSAETARVHAENARSAAESSRATAESNRVSAENARAAAETGRANAENSREAAETARAAAEIVRANTETQRTAAENARNVWENYSATKAYAVGNKVSYQGSSYVCIQAGTGTLPTDTAYWTLIAAKGVDGKGAGDMLAATYDPTGKAQDVFAYATARAAAVQANLDAHAARTDNPHGITCAKIGAQEAATAINSGNIGGQSVNWAQGAANANNANAVGGYSAAQLLAAAAAAGGKVTTGSYTGTGTFGPSNPSTLTFPFVPKIVLIYNIDQYLTSAFVKRLVWLSGSPSVQSASGQTQNGSSSDDTVRFNQTGNSLSWYGSSQWGYEGKSQCNELNSHYGWIAIG